MQYPPQKPNQNDADQLINNDFRIQLIKLRENEK